MEQDAAFRRGGPVLIPLDGKVVLEVEGLRTYFFTARGVVRAVDGVSLKIALGECLGLVGESGSGKTVTALSILRLVPEPGRIVGGTVKLDGRNLLELPEAAMREVRGRHIAMIFQDPTVALNPAYRVNEQVADVIRLRLGTSRSEARDQAWEWLARLGIPESYIREYPHRLSGGMRQRVLIAMALCLQPRLLIADEPTTALDVTVQAQVLDILQGFIEEMGFSMMLITHDLGVVARVAHRVAVMYGGMVIEEGPVRELFRNPLHPYTQGLMEAARRLRPIPEANRAMSCQGGCRFAVRCPEAIPECGEGVPELREIGPAHWVRCIRR